MNRRLMFIFFILYVWFISDIINNVRMISWRFLEWGLIRIVSVFLMFDSLNILYNLYWDFWFFLFIFLWFIVLFIKMIVNMMEVLWRIMIDIKVVFRLRIFWKIFENNDFINSLKKFMVRSFLRFCVWFFGFDKLNMKLLMVIVMMEFFLKNFCIVDFLRMRVIWCLGIKLLVMYKSMVNIFLRLGSKIGIFFL